MSKVPAWIEHDGSAVCPVPAGHDVEVQYRNGALRRTDTPESFIVDWDHNCTGMREHDITHYRDWTAWEQQQASAEVPGLEAIRAALNYADRMICLHEDTHRGGFLWTICNDCGRKWADDEGGFKPEKWPEIADAAYDALKAIAAHEQPSVDPLREALDDCWHLMTGPRGKAIDALTAELRARLPGVDALARNAATGEG